MVTIALVVRDKQTWLYVLRRAEMITAWQKARDRGGSVSHSRVNMCKGPEVNGVIAPSGNMKKASDWSIEGQGTWGTS